MKKTVSFIALLMLIASASAQYDLSCTFSAYTAGEMIDDDPMNGVIIIRNEGPALSIGDSITYGFQVMDSPYDIDLVVGYFSTHVLVEEMGTGDELSFGSETLSWLDLGVTLECCATVYGIGAAAVSDHDGDTNPEDNRSCIMYTLPVDDAGIEDLGFSFSKVYVDADQLMIVNDGYNSEKLATMSIVNLGGQMVQRENFALTQGTTTFNINKLAAGMYAVTIEVDGDYVTRKISIQ